MMPEQASVQDGLAGRRRKLSSYETFPGAPMRGGWIPILARESEFCQPFRIDWLCPRCGRLTAQSRTCPGCGLGIFESPAKFFPIEKRSKIYQYKKWIKEEAIFDDRSTGHKQKNHHRRRPIASSKKRNNKLRDKTPKHK